jgi:DNA-binding CsgD family transcriptional regulator
MDLVDAIDATAVDPQAWDRVAGQLRSVTDAVAAGVTFRLADGTIQQHWRGLDPEFERHYLESLYAEDPWARAATLLPAGRSFVGGDCIADATLTRSRFYQEGCLPFGYRDLVGAVLRRDEALVGSFGLFTAARSGPAQRDQCAWLDRMVPHFQRAMLAWQARAGSAEHPASGITSLLAGLGQAAVVVEADGRLVERNEAARAHLASGHGLRLDGPRVTTSRPALAPALALAIGRAIVRAPERAPLALPRPGGRAPLSVGVFPVPETLSGGRRLALVLVVDPDRAREEGAVAVQALFDLSPAETRLLALLARGLELATVAAETGTSLNTVRTQLRSVFRKTGCRRQAELLALVERLAPTVGA